METSEIYAALKTHKQTTHCIASVLPIDQLPVQSTLKFNKEGVQFIVVNLDSSDLPGSHWVALLISPVPGILNEYFDSYGLPPPNDIEKYIGNNYIRQTKCLQNFTSTICGQWCIYYIWLRCRGYTMRDITAQFDEEHLGSNDRYVNRVINQEFTGVDEPVIDRPFSVSQISREKRF